MSKWIPVTEDIPKMKWIDNWAEDKPGWYESDWVLGCDENGLVDIGKVWLKEWPVIDKIDFKELGYDHERGRFGRLVAWMPLPEPYLG